MEDLRLLDFALGGGGGAVRVSHPGGQRAVCPHHPQAGAVSSQRGVSHRVGILFVLMGIGAARIYLSRKGVPRTRALALFVIQLAFNFFWSIIFFNFQLFGLALVWLLALWVLIVLMTVAFYRVDRPAGLMQLPYLLWVTFALYLNGGVWLLN